MKNQLTFCLLLIIQSVSAQVVRLDSSNLPICIIDTRGKTIANEPKILAHMKVLYKGPGKMNYIKDTPQNYNNFIGIEIRGNSSQSYPQKQYGIELRDSVTGNDQDASLLDMPAEEDWILYAPYNDISMLRNVLIYHLWNTMGHWGPRTRFCELILNNEYQGIYILMESIKQGNDRVDVAKLKTTDSSGLDLTGGYIMKIDKINNANDKSFVSKVKATNNQNITWLYHYPESDDITVTQQNYIHKYIDTIEQLIASANFADPNTGYSKYLSTNSFIDYFLITELSRNVDSYKASSYFHKEKLQEDGSKGKFKAGPVWDYNFALGNASFCSGAQFTGWMYDGCVPATLPTPILWRRLLTDVNYLNQVKCRYTELRKTIWDTNYIFQFLHRYAFDTLDNAQKRHFTKWKILGTNPGGFNGYIANSYPDEMNKFKAWIRNRLVWMDANLQGVCTPPPPTQAKIKIPVDPDCFSGPRPAVELEQPFHVSPFNYNGKEKVKQVPAEMVRWVLIELRSAKDSSQLIDRRAALLRNDSILVDTNFQANVTFPNAPSNEDYFIVVRYSSFAFLMSKNKIKLPNVAVLNFNLPQNSVVPSFESSVIYDNQWLPSDTLALCKGARAVINDSNLIKMGYTNLSMSILSPHLHGNILNRHEVEISGDSVGVFPITVYAECDRNYIIRNKMVVLVHDLPAPEILGRDSFCIGDTIKLSAGNFSHYFWSNGTIEQEINITEPGVYTVEVTDEHACTGNASKSIYNFSEIHGRISVENGQEPHGCKFIFLPEDPLAKYQFRWHNGSRADSLISRDTLVTVRVTDAHGCEKIFEAHCISVNIVDNDASGNIFVFPNPGREYLSIHSTAPLDYLEMTDITGASIMNRAILAKEKLYTLNVTDVPDGIYFLHVSSSAERRCFKIWIRKN